MGKIYTKKGDSGKSSIATGQEITKASAVFALLGQIDQVNAVIGLLLAQDIADYGHNMLVDIQKDFMTLGAMVANVPEDKIKNKITKKNIEKLEKEIDEMANEMPELKNFILPGGSQKASLAHLVRSEIRTLERRLVGYNKIADPIILQWINRLSDFFFILARYFNYTDQIDEIIW